MLICSIFSFRLAAPLRLIRDVGPRLLGPLPVLRGGRHPDLRGHLRPRRHTHVHLRPRPAKGFC